MSNQNLLFQNFADSLWTANDELSLRRVAERVAEEMGFRWYAYLGLHDGQAICISNYSRAWVSHYFDQAYENLDPIVIDSRKRDRAFTWTGEGQQKLRGSSLNRFFAEARDFEIGSGVTVPIRSGFDRTTALTFATDGKSAEVSKMFAASSEIIELIGLYFHSRMDAHVKGFNFQKGGKLSQREAQCLSWAARGKTMAETGEIMSLTPRTISYHLENARNKLGASNVTHAVAAALRRGLIS